MLTFTEAITEIVRKKSHSKVGYQNHPCGDEQCSGCSMFVAPAGCTLVDPPISPNGWCMEFVRRDNAAAVRAELAKTQPGVSDVHAPTALGNEDPKRSRAKDFLTTIAEVKGGGRMVDVPASVGDASVGKKKKKKDDEGLIWLRVVRHGATKMNNHDDTSADRIRGWMDVPLTDEGREEAHEAGEALVDHGIEVIVSSDLSRAQETADIIGGIIGVKPTTSTKLRPWDLGKFTGKSTKDALPTILEYVNEKPDEPVPDGESFQDFAKRAFSGIAAAFRKADGKILCIVTHYRVERLLAAWDEAGQPADHSIDLKEFSKKGGPPGEVNVMMINLDALNTKGGNEVGKADTAPLRLNDLDGESAKSPFPHDQNALANLRPDQVPRFLGALTDIDGQDIKTVRLNSLVAMQDRVDPEKVQGMRDNPSDKLPLVIRSDGRNLIADGHHRLAAMWIDGYKTAPVRFKDISAVDNAVKMHFPNALQFDYSEKKLVKRFRAVKACPECGAKAGAWHKLGCSGHVLGDVEGIGKGSDDQPHGRWTAGDSMSSSDSETASYLSNAAQETLGHHMEALDSARDEMENAADERKSVEEELSDEEEYSDPKDQADWEQRMQATGEDAARKAIDYRNKLKDMIAAAQNHLDNIEGHLSDTVYLFRSAPQRKRDDQWSIPFSVIKADEDQQLVFGWGSVCSDNNLDMVEVDGEKMLVDKQGDMIPEAEMERAAYEFVLYCRKQGDMHERMGVGRLIESMAFTKQKQDVLGIDLGMVGWFIGFKVDDPGVWKRIKAGDLPEFSIGGKAIREAI
jgi:broad specificity phosphatase PhoE